MSTLKEFLYELSEELRFLPAKQVNEILKHYRDKVNTEVDYGANEEKVISEMKSPKEIAKGIYEMHGIDYLSKRKRMTKFKNILNFVFLSLALLAVVTVFIVGSIFIISVLINMLSLIGSIFKTSEALDVIVSLIFILSYFLIMIIIYIYIIDLFIVITNSIVIKLRDLFDKTRGKTYKFMNFTISGWLNKTTKKKNMLLKITGGIACVFLVSFITSYATKGRVYRSINDINICQEKIDLTDEIQNIKITGNNAYIILVNNNDYEIPSLEFEYEFSQINYKVNGALLEINVDQVKTYDFLGLLKTPLPIVRVIVPNDFAIDNIDINLDYGKIVFNQLQNVQGNINIKTINANISLNENKLLGDTLIESSSNTIVSKGNTINKLTIKQQTGTITMSEENINAFDHTNGSGNVKIVYSNIESYILNNGSGSIYLERINGREINYTTSTSLNELYDIYFDNGSFKVQNTGSLKITRSVFYNEVTIESLASSHQTTSYMSSPKINLKGTTGQIICEYVNCPYSDEKIEQFEENYRQYIKKYNTEVSTNNFDTVISINSKTTNVSLYEILAKELQFEISKASTAIVNLNIEKSKMKISDTGVKINNFYGKNMNLELISSNNYNSRTSVEYYNDNASDIEVTLVKDGMSEIIYSEFINVKYGE